jgi:thioesterase domain-containing protein
MPATELTVIHPGALSASCWGRLASYLPAGTPVEVLQLEGVNRFWAADPSLTVADLAERLQTRLDASRGPRVLVGWGVGGAVADALAAPSRRVILIDAPAPGAPAPDELRSFAMYVGARKGVRVLPREFSLPAIREAAIAVGALRPGTTAAAVERCFAEHAARVRRDHTLIATHTPSGDPLTVVKAAHSLLPDSPALGWDRYGPVERLGSGGDHYSMLTDAAAAAHLAMLVRRWLVPAYELV